MYCLCKCVLPPGANPIAVDKYININIYNFYHSCQRICNAQCPRTKHVFGIYTYNVAAFAILWHMGHVMLFPIINVFYFHIITFRNYCYYVNDTNVVEPGDVAEVLQNTSNLFTIILLL
jgi:hypothetical protein